MKREEKEKDKEKKQTENDTAKQNAPAEEESLEQSSPAEEEDELTKANKKCMELNDKYLRLAADFDNYRRKSAQARIELISTASEEVIKGLLPVLDDCQRALDALRNSTDAESAKEGTDLIFSKLMGFLKTKGLERIEAIGKELDTDFHEAVAQFPVQEEEKKNKIIDITQQGYTLNGKVIRYAKVVVGI